MLLHLDVYGCNANKQHRYVGMSQYRDVGTVYSPYTIALISVRIILRHVCKIGPLNYAQRSDSGLIAALCRHVH